MIRIGVDHGTFGGIAVLKDLEVVLARNLPVAGEKSTRHIDPVRMELLKGEIGEIAGDDEAWWIVERVHSMPRQGLVSTFAFGRIVGQMETYMLTSRWGIKHCTPYQWKSAAGLIKVEKLKTAGFCRELIPSSRPFLEPVRNKMLAGGIADAILIARFGWS